MYYYYHLSFAVLQNHSTAKYAPQGLIKSAFRCQNVYFRWTHLPNLATDLENVAKLAPDGDGHSRSLRKPAVNIFTNLIEYKNVAVTIIYLRCNWSRSSAKTEISIANVKQHICRRCGEAEEHEISIMRCRKQRLVFFFFFVFSYWFNNNFVCCLVSLRKSYFYGLCMRRFVRSWTRKSSANYDYMCICGDAVCQSIAQGEF